VTPQWGGGLGRICGPGWGRIRKDMWPQAGWVIDNDMWSQGRVGWSGDYEGYVASGWSGLLGRMWSQGGVGN
jgi:hypothetical protein